MSQPERPIVFISYSHDSPEHAQRVLNLAQRLRQDGVETILDQYVEGGSPAEGWPRWMLNGLNNATRVLCVCTPTYYQRFRGHEEPGKGRGVDWEGAIMTYELYDARSVSNRFIPVVFSEAHRDSVPEPLRGQSVFRVDLDSGYQDLYDALLFQDGVDPAPVGQLRRRIRAVQEWSEATVSRVAPVSLVLQTITFATVAAWCFRMGFPVLAAIGLFLVSLLIGVEAGRRFRRLPAVFLGLYERVWIRNRRMEAVSLGGMAVVIVGSWACTFIEVDSLPDHADAIEISATGGTGSWQLAGGNRRLISCAFWGRPVTIDCTGTKTIRTTAFPWSPLIVRGEQFEPRVQLVLKCSDRLKRVLPSGSSEAKATIRIKSGEQEIYFAELSGKDVVLTNDAYVAENDPSTVLSEQLSIFTSLTVEVYSAPSVLHPGGELMVGPLAFRIEGGETELTIPGLGQGLTPPP
ncbi:MAG: TIR domain-containing protein [Planctomycetaceae bacterium]|nr:TIR domain-containing protein [Planctomycetaceae bacterium]